MLVKDRSRITAEIYCAVESSKPKQATNIWAPLFDRATYMSSDHDVMAEAWYWMSQVVDDPAEKRKALENCLSTIYNIPRRAAHLQFWMASSNPMKS